MKKQKRISIDLLDEELREMIMNTSNILLIHSIDDLPEEETPYHYKILTGEERNNIYTWDIKEEKYVLIGADDKHIPWEDVEGKPSMFKPIPHEHTESDITDLDKYTKEETDALLNSKADVEHEHDYADKNHNHTESDIVDLDKYTQSEVNQLLNGKAENTHTHTPSDVEGLSDLLGEKVDKEDGKFLSSNDFTDDYREKLEGLTENASLDYSAMYSALEEHQADNEKHITTSERTKWNGKADKTTVQGHIDNATVHVTQTDKDNWNAKSEFSGSYDDLEDKPSLFSGNYEDLSNKPSIPSKTSDLMNDSRYITQNDVPSNVSELNNDTGFITSNNIPTKLSEFQNDTNYITQDQVPDPPPATNVGSSQPTNGAETWYKVL